QFDWNMTRNENMADISGLNIAYQTWQTLRESSANPTDPKLPRVNLNTRQMFFLSAAQRGYVYKKCTRICVKVEWKTTLSSPDQDSDLDLTILGSLVYFESSALDHAAIRSVRLATLRMSESVIVLQVQRLQSHANKPLRNNAKKKLHGGAHISSYCSNLTPEDYILLVEMDFHTPYPERWVLLL
ncbi:unnamed protein product, partial [Timema podura]|nr:unnamed protein product [Timema podura]